VNNTMKAASRAMLFHWFASIGAAMARARAWC